MPIWMRPGSKCTILLQAAAQQLELSFYKVNHRNLNREAGMGGYFLLCLLLSLLLQHQVNASLSMEHSMQHSWVWQSTHTHLSDCKTNIGSFLDHFASLFYNAFPVILIGSDYPHLSPPIESVPLEWPGGPAAVTTRLGTIRFCVSSS